MPPSLSKGTSKIVPVKIPDSEKQAAKSVLQTGETLSGFMREAARLLVKKRKGSIMSTAAVIPMKWASKNQGSMEHCACCGRKLIGDPVFVEVIDGGSSVAAIGLDPDESDAGYMGFFPVGKSCARKNFRGFTHDSNRT